MASLERSQEEFQVWCDRLLLDVQDAFLQHQQQALVSPFALLSPEERLFAIVVEQLSSHFGGHWSLKTTPKINALCLPEAPAIGTAMDEPPPVQSHFNSPWTLYLEGHDPHFVHPVPSYQVTLQALRHQFLTRLNHSFAQHLRILAGIQALYTDQQASHNQIEELKQVNQLKSEFLANTSHEIRTPLSSILGFTHLLREQEFNPGKARHQEYLRIILTSGQHLLALINDILDLSKIEANQLDLNREIVEISPLCNVVMSLVQEKANDRGLRLQLDIASNAQHFFCDPLRVKQMLFNLLSNALKFTTIGTVGLRVEQDDQATIFTVWDTGKGIPEEQLNLLFRPYQQLPNTTSPMNEGTGLGLALTKKLAELHGGSVSVSSAFQKGSTFQVRIPRMSSVLAASAENTRASSSSAKITAPPAHPEAEPAFPTSRETTSQASGPSKADRSILLVEDNFDNAHLIVSYLARYHYSVTWVSNAEDFWITVAQDLPLLVLMDINLPEVDGLTLIRQMRSEERYRQIPIIAQTALAMSGDREICLAAGATEYMTKPLDLQHLLARVRAYCKNGE